MTPERWQQIEALYHVARERGRKILVDADPELRTEVEKLLAQDASGGMPDHAAADLMTESTMTIVGAGLQLGPYRIEAPIGKGGMGEVFRATDTRLGCAVAIKVSHEKFGNRFEREARAIAALNHPHICTLYDVGPNYLVMELVEGETLAARLKRGKLSSEQTLQYGTQIADALAAAHAKGITHRDLKPGNIMLAKSGVKVLDFGLAKSQTDSTVTAANAVMGTPAYMAPEQLEGREADARTDVYALGLVLYEMASGKRVAQERAAVEPAALDRLIGACLVKDPEERFESARDVRTALQWAAETPVAVKPRTLFWPWLVATAAVLMAVVLGVVHFRESAPEARVTYSTALPPEKASFDFGTNLGTVALSPDGRRMVFAATRVDGKSQLWLRALDAAQAQPLQGTEGGRFPFWAPDSRWVGFFADQKLKKIDTQGGPPITVAEALAGYGGSWSASGVIVFAANQYSALRKVSSNGGNPTTATAMEVASETFQRFPCFLPDGEHFLFVSRRTVGATRMNLLVGSLRSTATQIIGQADSNAMYADGRLLYLRESTLMAQSFDTNALRTTGDAVPVAEGVEHYVDAALGTFSVSATGLLAYQTGSGGGRRQLTWFDRSGTLLGRVGEPRTFFDVELSPDGKSFTASILDDTGNWDLWVYDSARGVPTRLTFDPAAEYYGVWSPDQRSIILNSTRRGHYDLYRKPANGSGAEELLWADDEDKVPTSLSPDGRFLLYFTGTGTNSKDLWVLPLVPERPGPQAGTPALKPAPFVRTPANETFGQFSADGRWVAYDSDESQRWEIYVVPFSRPAEKHQISFNGGYRPRWRRDGKEIFYLSLDGHLMAADVWVNGDAISAGASKSAVHGSSDGGWPDLRCVAGWAAHSGASAGPG